MLFFIDESVIFAVCVWVVAYYMTLHQKAVNSSSKAISNNHVWHTLYSCIWSSLLSSWLICISWWQLDLVFGSAGILDDNLYFEQGLSYTLTAHCVCIITINLISYWLVYQYLIMLYIYIMVACLPVLAWLIDCSIISLLCLITVFDPLLLLSVCSSLLSMFLFSILICDITRTHVIYVYSITYIIVISPYFCFPFALHPSYPQFRHKRNNIYHFDALCMSFVRPWPFYTWN